MAHLHVGTLDERSERLRERERTLLQEVSAALTAFVPGSDDVALLRQATADLDTMFLLVVVGEFNAGKSAFINALLGAPALEEGVTPTTSVINVVRYGSTARSEVREEYLVERTYPADFLRNICVVDTPGTNAIIRRHEEITERFAPRSDLVLFVTSADRPFTESERAFLEKLRNWGKSIVIILNKVDLLTTQQDRETVLTFIQNNAQALLGVNPPLFPVSARQALAAKAEPSMEVREQRLAESGFARLEEYIWTTLDDRSRIRLKLLNPLGVAEAVVERYRAQISAQQETLAGDIETERTIQSQMELFRQDMQRDAQPRIAAIEAIIYETEQRGLRYFDDTMRLGRLFDLLNAGRLRAEFAEKVLADSSDRIDGAVQELIDWMVSRELNLWQGVMDYLARRRQAATDERLIGQLGGAFNYDRRELLQSVSRAARAAVDSFDRQTVMEQMTVEMRSAVAQTGLAEVGAVGLGAVVVTLASAAAIDITGILAAVVVAGLGLYVIPARRRRAQREFSARMADLRQRLTGAMREQFDRELGRATERVGETVAPYSRFVRAERDRIERFGGDFSRLRDGLGRLHREIDQPD